jgi:hypothetical protein
MFRVQAVGEIPKVGMMAGVSFQHVTGKPWSSDEYVRLPQGGMYIYLEPRGTHRMSSQTILDIRVSKVFRLGEGRRVELLVDIFNALQDTAGEFVSNTISRDNYGEEFAELMPRRAMLGVKFVF